MTVIVPDEIELNGKKYHIRGGVKGGWLDPFPEQFTTGDPSYDNRRDLSSWIINDLRNGIGVEEMDEKIDANRCWWTNCIIKYRNHILPPRLATKVTTLPTTVSAPTIDNANMELDNADWTNGARSNVQAHGGTYSWLVNAGGGGDAYQDVSTDPSGDGFLSKAFIVDGWIWQTGASTSHIIIDDGVGTTSSATFTATGAWTHVHVIRVIDGSATRVRITLDTAGGTEYFDDLAISGQTIGDIIFVNFNGESYIATGDTLAKLNSARNEYEPVGTFPATITALTASLNSRLYIYLGDSEFYWWMDTSEVFTRAITANAYWGFQHDAKLFKVNTSGTVEFSTDPDDAAPTWSSGGAITDIAAQIEGFVVGRDANGNYVPYAATHSITKVYDSATPQWIDTEARLPNHPIGGRGHAYWNGKLYFSYGLGLKEYYPETGAYIDIGLTERDGLPVEYNGEIVKLLGDTGLKGMFAGIDASITSGNSKSGLYLYDGFGWQCWWVPLTTLIEDCEDDWQGIVGEVDSNSADTTDFQVGSASVKLEIAAGASAGNRAAIEDFASIDLSQHNSVSLRVKSSIALDSGDYQLLLDDTAACVSPIETLDIPALSANIWTKVVLTLASPSSDTAIISVGIKTIVDKGAFTLRIDHIEAQTYNQAIDDIIVSSAQSEYAVYFVAGGDIWYIDIPRGIENPDKITQSYETSGILLSPWFDAGNDVAAKLAKVLADFANGITTTETVELKYRIDHINTDLDTGWTTLETLNTTDESGFNEELFASGAGLSFKAIQFRLDFVTGGSTSKGDIKSLVLYFKKRTGLEKLRQWVVTVLCDDHADTKAKEKITNLKGLIESSTDVTFLYRANDGSDESFYVTVDCPEFKEESGRDYAANYNLVLTES